MTAAVPAIELIDVGKHFGNVSVLTSINLAIADGEFIALLGPSGCGKSTLLKLIAGLEELSEGEIYVGGRLANYLKPSDRDVAMVFQNYALYPHMTVRENIGFPLKMSGLAKDAIRAKVEGAASFLQLGPQLDRFPDELSGGQRQRVALGRAIVREPVAFLMDEPLSNLDALLRVEMRTELVRLHKRVGRTTIYVTHDQVEAMTMANRIVLMHKGIIQQVGTPDEVYSHPANTFVATFVGSPPMNLFQGNVKSMNGGGRFVGAFELPLEGVGTAEGPVTLGIRPEQVQIVPTGTPQALGATVEMVERVGADSFVVSQIASGVTINARVDASKRIKEGDRVAVRLPAAELRLFDAAGLAVSKGEIMSAEPSTKVHRYHAAHPTFTAGGTPLPLPTPPASARYPLTISPDRRRLLDADGNPFLVQGDTCWSLIANLDYADAVRYLDNRKAKGFNTLLINLIEHLFSKDPPRDRAGHEPFSRPGDMSTPNDAYFDAAERVLLACAERGFCVILAPCYIGYKHDRGQGISPHFDGWYDEIVATGPEGCRRYGEYLGRRFGHFANIIWCMGGDWHPEITRSGLDAIAHGIRSMGVKNLFTAHPHPEYSPIDSFPGADWLDVNITYTYGTVHRALIEDWKRDPAWPFFLLELTYEGEHNAGPQQIRRQAYWSVLCGGNGHVFGNHPIWLLWDGWQEAMDLSGSVAMARWGDCFRGLPWAELVPDLEHVLVTGGLGEARGLDRVTAAMTADHRLGAAYLPVRRPIEIDLGALKGPRVSLEWFEPATGRRASGGLLAAEGRILLAPPFEEDSMLTLTVRA